MFILLQVQLDICLWIRKICLFPCPIFFHSFEFYLRVNFINEMSLQNAGSILNKYFNIYDENKKKNQTTMILAKAFGEIWQLIYACFGSRKLHHPVVLTGWRKCMAIKFPCFIFFKLCSLIICGWLSKSEPGGLWINAVPYQMNSQFVLCHPVFTKTIAA